MDVMMIFDVVMIGIGIYMVVTSLQMKKENAISQILLAEEELIKCKDTEGFISYSYWREVVMGVALVLYGAISLLDKYIFEIGGVLDYVPIVLLLIVFFWFYRGLQTARIRFLM